MSKLLIGNDIARSAPPQKIRSYMEMKEVDISLDLKKVNNGKTPFAMKM